MKHALPDAADPVMFPAPEARAALEALLGRALEQARAALPAGRVAPAFDKPAFARALARFDFTAPAPLEELLPWTVEQMRSGNVQITHPRYFGLFNPAPGFPALCADRIAGAFNPQLAAAATSPAAVAIEAHVIAACARRAGLPAGSGGHFTNSGSEANFTALVSALTRARPAFPEEGVAGFAGRPMIYISKDAHLAWIKICQQAGLGRASVRLVETDGAGRMDAKHLAAAVRADREAGLHPVMIVATAGTTVAGMVDPLAACAGVARAEGAWFHADAAWGGAALASERLGTALAGIGQADSITIDAHKWFATTMGCGMYLTADPAILGRAFGVANGFMPSVDVETDPYMASVMWSRRFLGLRLFLNLAALGWAGFARHVERAVDLAAFARDGLAARGWRIANASALGVLCVAPPAGSRPARAIVREIVASGHAWVSAAPFEGRDIVRICVTNGQTGIGDVEALLGLLEHHAKEPGSIIREEGKARAAVREAAAHH